MVGRHFIVQDELYSKVNNLLDVYIVFHHFGWEYNFDLHISDFSSIYRHLKDSFRNEVAKEDGSNYKTEENIKCWLILQYTEQKDNIIIYD